MLFAMTNRLIVLPTCPLGAGEITRKSTNCTLGIIAVVMVTPSLSFFMSDDSNRPAKRGVVTCVPYR
jgi:hypothetical protein